MTDVSGRCVAPLIAVVLLLFGCSSDSSTTGPAASSRSGGEAATTTSIVIGADGSSSVIVAPSESSSSAIAGPTPVGPGPAPSEIDPTGPPGSFAPGILSPAYSSAIDVDVRAQSSAEPRAESIDHVVGVLRAASGKSVSSPPVSAVGGGAQSWSADDLRALATTAAQPGHARIQLLFLHGTFGGDDSVLGVAFRGDAAAIFIDRVNASATPLVGSAGIEAAVVMHEVGHLLGLVDLYLHTGRQDPDHPGHSTDRNSVMYWAVESDLVADLLQGGPPRDFDDADLADLKTIHDGG
jgi:hypothetical protein